MNKFFSGAYGLEIQLATGSGKVNFPDIPFLRDKRIKHIDICHSAIVSKTPSGNETLAFGIDDLFLTIREQNSQRELIKSLPVTKLNPAYIKGARLFINKIVDIQNSYIDYSKLSNIYLDKWLYVVFYFDYPEMWSIIKDNQRTAILPLEVKLTGKRTYFDENKELYRRSIQNIMLSLPTITATGNDGIIGSNNKFLTLSYNNKDFISQLPLTLLKNDLYNFPLRFQNVKFDVQSSYIDTADTTVNDLKSVFLNFIVDDNK